MARSSSPSCQAHSPQTMCAGPSELDGGHDIRETDEPQPASSESVQRAT